MKKHPFESVSAGGHDTLRELSRRTYEAGRVLKLLNTLEAPKWLARKISEIEKTYSGAYRLSFRAMRDACAFPYFLAADPLDGAKLHVNPLATLPMLFEKFPKTPIAEAFDAFLLTVPKNEDRPAGLVFRRKGIPQGLLILEEAARLPKTYEGGTFLFSADDTSTRIVSYWQFLQALKVAGFHF